MPRAALLLLCFLAPLPAVQDTQPAPPAAERLLAGLRWPLPERLDRIPLLAPDDVAETQPFTVRLGARLYRTDLEDVEEYPAGTVVLAPWPDVAAAVTASGALVQELGSLGVRLTLLGLDAPAEARADAIQRGAVVGRLAASGPLPACDPHLQQLGYLPGPHVLLRIDGLFPDHADGHAAFRRFARERLLPALMVAAAARPAARPPRWAAPSERTLDGYARALLRGANGHATAPAVQPEPAPSPRLGFFRVVAGREQPQAERGAVFERLVAQFLAGLRWPYPNVAGLQRFAGEDDQYGRLGAFPHRALDLGARLQDHAGGFHVWPAGAPAYRLHTDLKGGRGELLFQDGEHVLRVELQAFHLTGAAAADGAIGSLEPYEARMPLGGWRTSDPLLRLLGVPKGNHLHVLVRGVFSNDEEQRATFLRERVLPAWLSAPGAPVAATVPPLPTPPAGDGADEDRDPRGAAILRAQLRLLARRLQPLGPGATGVALVPNTMDPTQPAIRIVVTTRRDTVLAPPVRDARVAPAGDDLLQELSATAAERRVDAKVRIRGATATSAGLRASGDQVELLLELPLPHARAWTLAHALPILRGADR